MSIVTDRDRLRVIAGSVGTALTEPSATKRILRAMYPAGVPAEQVADLPEVVAVARGLGQVCDGGHVGANPWRDIAAAGLQAQTRAKPRRSRRSKVDDPIGLVPVKEGGK